MLKEHVDGLLEGHEPSSTKLLTRSLVIIYVLVSLVAVVLNLALVTKPGSHVSSIVNSVAIIFLVGLTLLRIRWYGTDHQDPKQKRAVFLLMFSVLLLDVVAFMTASDTIHYQKPQVCPIPPPCPDPQPTTTTTTTAPNITEINSL